MIDKRGMSAAWAMVLATLLFAAMGLGVKKASAHVTTVEIVFFRGLVGMLLIGGFALVKRWPLSTTVPRDHLWRGVAGVSALCLWFYAIGRLPLATAVTLNYMSSVWMAVFLVLRQWWRSRQGHSFRRIDAVLLWAIGSGFVGVTLVLQPTLAREQWLEGLAGLCSGMLAAWAYLQVVSLGRQGEPEYRVVFYFSASSVIVGLIMVLLIEPHHLTWPADRSAATWGWLVSVGVFATAAQILMTRAYAVGKALSMASLQYLGIVHAFILGITVFGETLHWLSVLGAGLIIAAGIVANRMSRGLNN